VGDRDARGRLMSKARFEALRKAREAHWPKKEKP